MKIKSEKGVILYIGKDEDQQVVYKNVKVIVEKTVSINADSIVRYLRGEI